MLNYNTRGFIIKSSASNDTTTKYTIHYLNITPSLSLDLGSPGLKGFTVGFGPVAGVAMSGTEKITVNGITNSSKMKFSTSKDYGYIDLGLHSYISYTLRRIFLELGYYHGLASINNNEEIDKRNIRNYTFSLSLGYFIKNIK